MRAGKLRSACTLSVNTSWRPLKMCAVPSPCEHARSVQDQAAATSKLAPLCPMRPVSRSAPILPPCSPSPLPQPSHLVNVQVEDEHSLHPPLAQQQLRGDSQVVEDAEPGAIVAECVVRACSGREGSCCSSVWVTPCPVQLPLVWITYAAAGPHTPDCLPPAVLQASPCASASSAVRSVPATSASVRSIKTWLRVVSPNPIRRMRCSSE